MAARSARGGRQHFPQHAEAARLSASCTAQGHSSKARAISPTSAGVERTLDERVEHVVGQRDAGGIGNIHVADRVEIEQPVAVFQAGGVGGRHAQVQQRAGGGKAELADRGAIHVRLQAAQSFVSVGRPEMDDDAAFRSQLDFLRVELVHVAQVHGEAAVRRDSGGPVLRAGRMEVHRRRLLEVLEKDRVRRELLEVDRAGLLDGLAENLGGSEDGVEVAVEVHGAP